MPDRLHTRVSFDADLFALRSGVLAMAELAALQFRRATQALLGADFGLAAQVLADERELNVLQVTLDAACSRVIARHQPTAIDLREVIGALHAVGDLERIGDESKKMATRSASVGAADDAILDRIARMAERAARMVDQATAAYRDRDASAAAALALADDQVDADRDALVAELATRLGAMRSPVPSRQVEQMLDLILVVQSIERVADHAEGFGDYVINVAEGIDPRHGNAPRP